LITSRTRFALGKRCRTEGEEIKSCEEAGITVTLPKPQTSSSKAEGRFFVYVAAEDVYRCPAGERLTYRFAGVEDGKTTRRYCWMGATHFLMRKLHKVSTEMALNVLAYNLKRVIAIVGVGPLLEALTI
jgi:hypothetical protein